MSVSPHVYGTPLQMANLLDSIGKIVDAEPDETFADNTVQDAAQGLTDRLRGRLPFTDAEQHAINCQGWEDAPCDCEGR